MKILNVGSLNIDYVYRVAHFVRPGETIASLGLTKGCGGKGLNQSVALARAGARTAHAGCVGMDGLFLRQRLEEEGVDVSGVRVADAVSGHAVIQVDAAGQNAILLYPGTNHALTQQDIAAALSSCAAGDWLLVQNETNGLDALLRGAAERGVRIALNPSPITPELTKLPLHLVDCFLLNEIEGAALSGAQGPQAVLDELRSRYPRAQVVLTLGGDGVRYWDGNAVFAQPIFPVPVADTTAAGDTFTGYFLAGLIAGLSAPDRLRLASGAAALAVSRKGAAASIPRRDEVEQFLNERSCR